MSNLHAPYKLVVVLQDLEFGGTQRYALNLLRHIDRNLFDPELWVLRGGEDMAIFCQQAGVKTIWFSKKRDVTPVTLYRFFLYLAKNRPTYLYSLTVVPNIWARIFGCLLRVPVIISSYRNLIAKQYESLLWPLSTHIICNTEAIQLKLIETHNVKSSRISVVANGVDTDFFSPDYAKQSSQPTVIYAGRLVPQKDPQTLLESFKIIQQKIPEAQLIVIGNGSLRPDLELFIKQHALEKKISLIPGTADIKKHMQSAQVFLLASRYEGSPNILIEAMACGLPVVATRTSGIPELIEHGVNGYMVSPGDSTDLAELTIKLLRENRLREEMGKEARNRVIENHKLETCVRLTEKILLDQHPDNYQE